MSTKVLPATQLGVLTSKDGSKLQTFPVPSPGPGEVLIQNVAVASNPKDWLVPFFFDNYSHLEGNDTAGYVVMVGDGVTEYKGREKVAAYTKFATRDDKYGTNAQYSVAPVSTTFLIPDGISFEEAATIPLTTLTSIIGLYKTLDLDEPPRPGNEPSFAPDNGKAIIIYSASSSTGAYATQLAKRAGYYVIAVAGSVSYAESLGADKVIDYRDKNEDEMEAALIEAAKGHSTSDAYDAFADDGSHLLLARVLSRVSPTKKGRVAVVRRINDEDKNLLPDGVTCEWVAAMSAEGTNKAFASRLLRQVASYLVPSKGNPKPFQPNRVRIVPNGLAGIPDGLELLKSKQVHGEKLVYRISDTPGLQL